MDRSRGLGNSRLFNRSADAVEGVPVRRHKPDYQIALYMALLMLLGLVVMYAIGPQRANLLNSIYGAEFGQNHFFVKQAMAIGVALVAFAALALVSYRLLIKFAGGILVVAFLACLLLSIADWFNLGIAQEALGATRWFDLGLLSLQPSELLKFGFVVFLAVFLASKVKQGKLNDIRKSLVPLGALVGLAMLFVVVFQKDLGTGLALFSIVASILLVAGINLKNAGIIGLVSLAAIILLIAVAPHRMSRVVTFLKGDETSVQDAGSYHAQHAKIALGTGGLFGLGIGNSVQATGYLPESINDSVFAIMGETFGFVGSMIILALFVALLIRLLKLMDHLVDVRLKLMAAGVFGWLCAHVILNIAAMTGLLPITGITLPLLSFGGTSMVFMAAAIGLMFQLSRYTVHGSRLQEKTHEGIGSRGRVGRTRYAGRRGN